MEQESWHRQLWGYTVSSLQLKERASLSRVVFPKPQWRTLAWSRDQGTGTSRHRSIRKGKATLESQWAREIDHYSLNKHWILAPCHIHSEKRKLLPPNCPQANERSQSGELPCGGQWGGSTTGQVTGNTGKQQALTLQHLPSSQVTPINLGNIAKYIWERKKIYFENMF